MNRRKLRLKLADGTFEYTVVSITFDSDFQDTPCPKCAKSLVYHGELLQWGFWEDTHTYLCKCSGCNAPIAVEQVMPVDLEVTKDGEE